MKIQELEALDTFSRLNRNHTSGRFSSAQALPPTKIFLSGIIIIFVLTDFISILHLLQ